MELRKHDGEVFGVKFEEREVAGTTWGEVVRQVESLLAGEVDHIHLNAGEGHVLHGEVVYEMDGGERVIVLSDGGVIELGDTAVGFENVSLDSWHEVGARASTQDSVDENHLVSVSFALEGDRIRVTSSVATYSVSANEEATNISDTPWMA